MLRNLPGGDRQVPVGADEQDRALSAARRSSTGRIASPPRPGELTAMTGTDSSIIASGPCSRSAPEKAWALT